MPEKDPAATFDATGDRAADVTEDLAADATEDLADRRARAARIRRRSLELIEALGADHPLVAEALARADALDGGTTERPEPSELDARGAADRGDADTIDLRSSADLSH